MPEHYSLSWVLLLLGFFFYCFSVNQVKHHWSSPNTIFRCHTKKTNAFLPQIFSFLRKKINALETGTKTRLFNLGFFSKIKSQLLHLSCKGLSANSNLKLIESVIEFDVKFFSHLIWHQVWLWALETSRQLASSTVAVTGWDKSRTHLQFSKL